MVGIANPMRSLECKIDFLAARILDITHYKDRQRAAVSCGNVIWFWDVLGYFGCPLATRTVMGWTL